MSISPIVSKRDRILGGLWGSLVGDALGVPVEFRNRLDIQIEPVTGMREFGTHRQPKGTWSDDGALILCTVDSLLNHEFDTRDMGEQFVRWMNTGLWTATGESFDVGCTTADALMRIANGTPSEEAGGRHEDCNGNGSLMRIIPVALRFAGGPAEILIKRVERASAISHGHERSKAACAFYSLMVEQLLLGKDPSCALKATRSASERGYNSSTLHRFKQVLEHDLCSVPEGVVVSTGYVLHTLHASFWCLINTSNYADCVLKAVNLGGDTDTTACVAGGLAGVAYGIQAIPSDWRSQLARQDDLAGLLDRFAELCLRTDKLQKGHDRD
jgi:ADP-ribosylglycohydrolase